MNTRFAYFYRSPSNTKKWGAVVFSGVADGSSEQRLTATFDSFEFFIADQLRVPELFFHDGLTPEEDKCWHEFASLEVTTEEVTDRLSRSIEEFVAECEAASREGWKMFDPNARETGGYR